MTDAQWQSIHGLSLKLAFYFIFAQLKSGLKYGNHGAFVTHRFLID